MPDTSPIHIHWKAWNIWQIGLRFEFSLNISLPTTQTIINNDTGAMLYKFIEYTDNTNSKIAGLTISRLPLRPPLPNRC